MKRMRMPKRIRRSAVLLTLGSAGLALAAMRASTSSTLPGSKQLIALRKGQFHV